jgi:hypothetical protein
VVNNSSGVDSLDEDRDRGRGFVWCAEYPCKSGDAIIGYVNTGGRLVLDEIPAIWQFPVNYAKLQVGDVIDFDEV